MPTRQHYKPRPAVRVLVWPLALVLAAGYMLAIRTLYRTAMSLLPDSIVWALLLIVATILVRWMLLAVLESKRTYIAVEDEAAPHGQAA